MDIRQLYTQVLIPLARCYGHPRILDTLKNHILLLTPEVCGQGVVISHPTDDLVGISSRLQVDFIWFNSPIRKDMGVGEIGYAGQETH
jgi:hypothetical protein